METLIARILLDHIFASVPADTQGMDCSAMTSMNVFSKFTIVLRKPYVKTHRDLIAASVQQALLGMEVSAKISMNVLRTCTLATKMNLVKTLLVRSSAPVVHVLVLLGQGSTVVPSVRMEI